jgi:inner membrane protein
MYKSGHMGINMMLFSPILFIMVILDYILAGIVGLALVTYFASLPDMDLQYWFLKHRGFTHTYSFGILVGSIIGSVSFFIMTMGINSGVIEETVFNIVSIPLWGFFLGLFMVLGHISGDIITPAGVRPFQKPKYIPNLPIFSDKRYTFDLVYAANMWANSGFLVIGVASVSLALFSSIYIISDIPL